MKIKVKKAHILYNEKCHIYYIIIHYIFLIPQSAESMSDNNTKTKAMTTAEKPQVITEADKNERSEDQAYGI